MRRAFTAWAAAAAATAAVLATAAGAHAAAPDQVAATAAPAAEPPATTAAEPPACEVAPTQRPPDPRCGEAIDGRPPVQPPPSVPGAVLWVPRLASRALLWPVVETTDFIEHHQLAGWLDALLTTDDKLVGVRPEVHYSTSFLPTGGIRLFYRRLPGAGSELAGRFLTAGPAVLLAQAQLRGPDWLGLSLGLTWNRRDDRLFAGIGPNSKQDLASAGLSVARYGSDIAQGELRWSRRLPRRLFAGLHTDLQWRGYRATEVRGGPPVSQVYGLPPDQCAALGLPQGCVDPAIMPGFARGLRMAHAGAALALDLRDHARDGSGASLAFDATYGRGLAGDPSRHLLLSGETVLALGGIDRVVLLRLRAAMVQRLASAPVPFEELISPAGQDGMRGFPDGRFRDASAVVATVEYRWFVAANLDALLFADGGTVAGPEFADLRWDRWFPTFGVGLRMYSPDGPHWEAPPRTGIQLAYAPDNGFRLLFSLAGF